MPARMVPGFPSIPSSSSHSGTPTPPASLIAEIEVGEARFAAGDQAITRVNDHASQIYNRERWRALGATERILAERRDLAVTATRIAGSGYRPLPRDRLKNVK